MSRGKAEVAQELEGVDEGFPFTFFELVVL